MALGIMTNFEKYIGKKDRFKKEMYFNTDLGFDEKHRYY
jgi:hypothetical protein